jgi:hypothetical protein
MTELRGKSYGVDYFVRPGERLSDAAARVATDAVYEARDAGGTMHDAGALVAERVFQLIERRGYVLAQPEQLADPPVPHRAS